MKTYLLLFLFVFCTVLFAQHNSLVTYWRFVDWNEMDYTDVSGISFEAELIPGSGDMQTQESIGADILSTDIGLGWPNSFITFDFANFANPWQPDNHIRVRINAFAKTGEGFEKNSYDERIVLCSFMSEAPAPFYGWNMEGYGEPFAAQPFVVVDWYMPGQLDWGNGVTGFTHGDGVPSNELTHNVNGICPNIDEIPFYGTTGYYFTHTFTDNPNSWLAVNIGIDLGALGYAPGQVGWYIEGQGWSFIPEIWDYENPQPVEWTIDCYEPFGGSIGFEIPLTQRDKSIVDVLIAFSAGSDIPLGNHSGPENVIIEISEETVNISWDEVAWATSYTVFSCDDSNGIFTENISGIFNGTSWSAPVANDKKFYKVIAIR
jgi:hypothetical protein